MVTRKIELFLLTVAVYIALSAGAAQAQLYNLADDWSDVNNPNGAWALYKAPGQLFTISQSDWYNNGTNQSAWADAPSTTAFPPNPLVPMWAKAIGDFGALFGDSIYNGFVDTGTVFMASAESYRTGTDFSSAVWTSPHAGTVRIDGGLWISKAFDRPHTWELRLNSNVFTSGALSQTDPYTKTNPFAFAAGSGGASAVKLTVAANDQIELLMYRPLGTLVPGTFVGMNYQISFVPEPSSLLLGVFAMAGLARLRRRTQCHVLSAAVNGNHPKAT
jgi:hypothetical protein